MRIDWEVAFFLFVATLGILFAIFFSDNSPCNTDPSSVECLEYEDYMNDCSILGKFRRLLLR